MTLIGHTMMCEQAGPEATDAKAATMQLLSDGQFTLGLAQGRISTSTLPAGNGRTPCPDRGRGSPGLQRPTSRISRRAAPADHGLIYRELCREDPPPATFAGLDRQVVLLAKTADRSVLGCTNDMAFLYHHDP